MSAHKIALWFGVAMFLLSLLAETGLEAQPPATNRPGTAAASSEAAKKAQILASDRWRNMRAEFDQWLSVQVVYTPRQVAQLKARLSAEVQRMSAAELQEFVDDMDAKLKVSLSKDADEARAWLGQYMSAMSDGYRKKFLAKMGLSNPSNMTAAQLEEQILNVRLERASIRQQQAVYDQNRLQMVQSQQQADAAAQQRQARDQALLNSASAAPFTPYPSSVQGPYNPRRLNNDRMNYYVNPSGEIGYSFNF